MTKDPQTPAGVTLIPTVTMRTEHTVLTEILSGKVFKRLVITEPRTNLKGRMHRHLRRDDYICMLSGQATLTTYSGKTHGTISLKARDYVVVVPRGIWHRYDSGAEKTIIIEASTETFDPNDVEEYRGSEPV